MVPTTPVLESVRDRTFGQPLIPHAPVPSGCSHTMKAFPWLSSATEGFPVPAAPPPLNSGPWAMILIAPSEPPGESCLASMRLCPAPSFQTHTKTAAPFALTAMTEPETPCGDSERVG